MLLPLLAFLFVSLLIAAGALALSPGATAAIERRLGEAHRRPASRSGDDDDGYDKVVIDTLKRMGNVAPRSAKEMGKLQQRLVTAGYRSNEALIVFFGIRLGLRAAAASRADVVAR